MAIGWAILADTIPIYPLYALLFADAGLSNAQISTLFVIWSAVGVLAEVPSGALADHFTRRAALVAAGVLQAGGYLLWITVPGYAAFAGGFVLWGLGGAFGSGALEALLYDGMASAGAEYAYSRVYSRVTSVGLLSQLPAAAAATVLFSAGGYDLVGWVSVACCLAAAVVASCLPETRPEPRGSDEAAVSNAEAREPGYLALLRSGLVEATRRRGVRLAVVAVAVIAAFDGLEEYFSLLARDWGVSTAIVPLVVLTIPLVGAVGAAVGGAATELRPGVLVVLFAGAATVFVGANVAHVPAGVAAVAIAYGAYRLVLVVTNVRLQARIEGQARATVTSVAALATDVVGIALYAALAVWR